LWKDNTEHLLSISSSPGTSSNMLYTIIIVLIKDQVHIPDFQSLCNGMHQVPYIVLNCTIRRRMNWPEYGRTIYDAVGSVICY
jgi:hypothetical protein